MDVAEKLVLHYYLSNDSHTMDALIRNKCEAELLAVIQEVASALGFKANIESEAYQEGGLKEIWQFLGTSNNQLMLFLSVVILIFSRIPLSDPEQDALNKEATKFTIEEKRLSIEKLKRELNAGEANKETIIAASNAIDSSLKVATRKSNFYKNLAGYEKVTGIGMAPLDRSNRPTADEKFVARTDFRKFIITTNELPVEVIEDAQIEIISPVLKEGNYRWKGVYQEIPISFSMNDAEFKHSVLREEISFQHGSFIECVLNIHRKFDEIGDIVITGYSVVTVIKKTDGSISLETAQGKKHKSRKKFIKDQEVLF